MKTWLLLPLLFSATLAIASEDDPEAETSEPPAKSTDKGPQKPTDLSRRQCRSVHLGYEAPAAKAAYIEVTPGKSSPGTYFCALGFNRVYLGVQDFGDGRKIAIFSIWGASDPTDSRNPPPADEQPVTLVQKGDNVLEGRLGGYGMAGQARLVFRWETGKPTRFFLQAKAVEDGTEFTAHVFDPLQLKWRLVGTFRSHGDAKHLEGFYSFIEDFRRNFESAKVVHKAEYTNGWVLTPEGDWQPLLETKFTADATPVSNVDAGPVPDGFFLQTGGDTENKTTKLWQKLTREVKTERPADLDELLRK